MCAYFVGIVLASLAFVFFFQAEDGIRDHCVTGVQTCALPILKAGTFWAEIFIFWPVWGFLPSLALRSLTENFPKSVICTFSQLLSASVTTSSKASKCLWASLLGTSAFWAILSISSFFFMVVLPSMVVLWLLG